MHFAYSSRVENMSERSSQHGWPRNATDTMCNERQDFLAEIAVVYGKARFLYQTRRLVREIKISLSSLPPDEENQDFGRLILLGPRIGRV